MGSTCRVRIDGKNSLLINNKYGSFCFIGIILLDVELSSNLTMLKNGCGSCTLCLDACPTGAIVSPGIVNANKCISYLTIENKITLPLSLKPFFNRRIFGCDSCQDVCPWNKRAIPCQSIEFHPSRAILNNTSNDWLNMQPTDFDQLFTNSAIKRTGYDNLMRNIHFVV